MIISSNVTATKIMAIRNSRNYTRLDKKENEIRAYLNDFYKENLQSQ